MIIYRGTLTKEKLVELAAEHLSFKADNYNPHKNPKVISIIQQDDGNWVAEGNRFGTVVKVRQAGPEIVLQMLLTHNGKQ